jgi:hypothetical protein
MAETDEDGGSKAEWQKGRRGRTTEAAGRKAEWQKGTTADSSLAALLPFCPAAFLPCCPSAFLPPMISVFPDRTMGDRTKTDIYLMMDMQDRDA